MRKSIGGVVRILVCAGFLVGAGVKPAVGKDSPTLNERADGYRGIWYYNQKSNDEYVYKYSGGLGTYCAKHNPFAVYRPEVNKTFFCYGGATAENNRRLLHMVSYYDHETGMVPRPTLLLDKKTDDAHDNPVISVDDAGHIWIFSTSHGRSRPSYIHKSRKPYDVSAFDRVEATYQKDGETPPLNNFSYLQVWHRPGKGFSAFFTHYGDPAARTSFFMKSADGKSWSPWTRLAAIEEGHYQLSAVSDERVGAAFNYHPKGKGLNWRTNLYFMESADDGETWRAADGTPLPLPLTESRNPALVKNYEELGKNVYIRDVVYDETGNPVIIYIVSGGYESGPKNDPRTWTTARWNGKSWDFHPITTSDNNYDMGSLNIDADGTWRLIAPTATGPQAYNPGGEMELWISRNRGETWEKSRQLTEGSEFNHTFARRPVNAHPEFYSLWADGHGRKPSESRLYFANRAGEVFRLPVQMDSEFAKPELVE